MRTVGYLIGALCLAVAAPATAQTAPSRGASQPNAALFRAGMRSVKFEAQSFERSGAFYVALGMKVVAKRDATWDLGWDDPAQGSGIQLTTPAYAQRAKMVRGGAMMILMTPDIVATAARLRSAGFADVPQPRAMGSSASVLMLHDPDGNRIELIGPPLGN